MTIQNYRDLKVWQKAKDLTKIIFQITAGFPKEQRYILVNQMQRAALSVPSNIAEGRSRHSENDFIYHLNIAKGSLAELETQIIIAQELDFIPEPQSNTLLEQCEEITRMLHGLKSSLKENKAKTYNLTPIT